MPHERRVNPLSCLGENNRELYYGDVASTAFWIVALIDAYNWTGDRELLKRQEAVFEDCLSWIEYKLEEGQGFVYYAPMLDTKFNNRNHAWKDSADAIVDREGKIVLPPLACAEIQAYAFMALLSATEIHMAMGRPIKARNTFKMAMELKKRFNEKFWMEDEKFFALALDGKGNQVDSITSNASQCLGTGIIDTDKIPDVVERTISSELFSGWGIRTLSNKNPAYDPFSYHRGSVWPVENSTIAGGLMICGYPEEATRVISAQLSLATLFENFRLPEVISGHERSGNHPVPGLYPYANMLQSWSVSTIALFLQIMTGIRPLAPIRTLAVYPVLPDWLPWVELHDLRVGSARVSLRFWRDEATGKSHWKILERKGVLAVIQQMPDLSPRATLIKRFTEAFRSVA
jgi:glycogen debranching enzyme